MSRDELAQRRPGKAITASVNIRVARGGFIVSHQEDVPAPWAGSQQGLALGPVPYTEGREAICATLEEVNKLVAELLGPR